jgi:hypothetical protein
MFFIDENEYISSESYILKGWVFNTEFKINEIRLSNNGTVIDSKINFQLIRNDVAAAYPSFSFNSGFSGFEIMFKPNMGNDIQFEIKVNDNWLLCNHITIMKNRLILKNDISKVNVNSSPSIAVIDNFYSNPNEVRELALSLTFNSSAGHKGKRTEVKYIVDGTRNKIEELLGKKILNWSNQPCNGVFQYCTSSDPIVYHYDSQLYAAVVFLTPNAPPETGTSFYRHKKETWLTKDPSDYQIWDNENHLQTFHDNIMGTEDDDFLDSTKWEEIDRVGNVYNRFVLWDAKLIHSATTYFGKSKENGRLFHMFFFNAY